MRNNDWINSFRLNRLYPLLKSCRRGLEPHILRIVLLSIDTQYIAVILGLPTFVRASGFHKKTLPTASLCLDTWPASASLRFLMIVDMREHFPYSELLEVCDCQETFSAIRSIRVYVPSSFLVSDFVSVQESAP